MKKFVHILLVLLIACPAISLVISSCSDESDCSIAGRATLRCTVYTISEETGNPLAASLEWLTITALGTDSILLNADEKVTDVFLPLQYTVDSTAIVFHYSKEDPKLRDTLVIWHQNTPHFISVDCGYDVKQKVIGDIEHTKHVLNSLRITNVNTSNNGYKNIELFY